MNDQYEQLGSVKSATISPKKNGSSNGAAEGGIRSAYMQPGKDPLLDSVRLRLEPEEVEGLKSAAAIARLLGHTKLAAQIEEN